MVVTRRKFFSNHYVNKKAYFDKMKPESKIFPQNGLTR